MTRDGADLRGWLRAGLDHVGGPQETKAAAAVIVPLTPEERAEALLAQEVEDPEAWRRSWAEVARRLGWPCRGATWAEWAAGDDVAQRVARLEAQTVATGERLVELETAHGLT
jgi:hypothetical protein